MVIQFACHQCHQPIEVDDEWAGRHVGCPYCRKVVTAPTCSTLRSEQMPAPPTARKMAPPPSSPPAAPPLGWLAPTALAVSLSALALYVVGSAISSRVLASHVGPSPSFQEVQKKMPELISQADTAPSLMLAGGMICLGLFCWAVGAGLSIWAMMRKPAASRGLALLALLCSALLPSFMLVNLLAGLF